MVSVYGMNEKIGNVSFYDSKGSEYKFDKPYSEATAQTIDEEVRKLITFAYDRTKQLLEQKKEELKKLAKALLEKEILFQTDLEAIIGKRPFDRETTYEKFTRTVDEKAKLREENEKEDNPPLKKTEGDKPIAPKAKKQEKSKGEKEEEDIIEGNKS
jgi:AFG3 family protein